MPNQNEEREITRCAGAYTHAVCFLSLFFTSSPIWPWVCLCICIKFFYCCQNWRLRLQGMSTRLHILTRLRREMFMEYSCNYTLHTYMHWSMRIDIFVHFIRLLFFSNVITPRSTHTIAFFLIFLSDHVIAVSYYITIANHLNPLFVFLSSIQFIRSYVYTARPIIPVRGFMFQYSFFSASNWILLLRFEQTQSIYRTQIRQKICWNHQEFVLFISIIHV